MYTVDAAACEVVWIGRKVTGEHRGNISISSGDFKVYGGAIVGGTINVDMTSMTNTDLDAESGAELLGHLASDDFFGTAQHPTATLSIETYVPAENGGTVKGMMTIKGISKPVSFDVIANPTEGGLELRGMMKVNRTEYEIKYGSGTFIENLGDKAIDDIFELGFFVVAKS
jgi:polyisoprenoid-binding protein YceI